MYMCVCYFSYPCGMASGCDSSKLCTDWPTVRIAAPFRCSALLHTTVLHKEAAPIFCEGQRWQEIPKELGQQASPKPL